MPDEDRSPGGRGGLRLSFVLPLIAIIVVVGVLTAILAKSHGSQKLPGNAKSATASGFDGQVLEPIRAAPSLGHLENYSGGHVNLASYRGKAVLVTFLYTHCPDVCPLITANLHNTLQEIGPALAGKTQIIAVSVDPHGDTRSTVAAFLKAHEMTGRMKYLTGDVKELAPVWEAWNVGSKQDAANPEFVAHTALVYGVSASGKIVTIYPPNFKPQQLAHDLPKLLRG